MQRARALHAAVCATVAKGSFVVQYVDASAAAACGYHGEVQGYGSYGSYGIYSHGSYIAGKARGQRSSSEGRVPPPRAEGVAEEWAARTVGSRVGSLREYIGQAGARSGPPSSLTARESHPHVREEEASRVRPRRCFP